MMEEEAALHALRRERIARVKRLLRWMPRRATMHRYPVLKWFAQSARRRADLWSFRTRYAIPAIYVGLILAFVPLYGVQLPLAVLFAFALRANLPILVGAQFITNPVTIVPIYFAAYLIGRTSLQLIGLEIPHLTMHEFKGLLDSVLNLEIRHSLIFVGEIFGVTTLGGSMMGLFLATLAALVYRVGAYEVAVTYRRLHEIQLRREAAHAEAGHSTDRPKTRFPKGKRLFPS